MKFSIHEFLKKRPLSHSALSSWKWNKRQWYDSYILNIRKTSKEMTFGNYVDKKIQDDPTFIPTLPRYPEMQYKMEGKTNKVPLIGIADGVDIDNYLLADYKTGKTPWDQKRADETEQFDFYLYLFHITKKLKPEDFICRIHWLPTKEEVGQIVFRDDLVVPITFETKRTTDDIIRFGASILITIKEMEDYVNSYPQRVASQPTHRMLR